MKLRSCLLLLVLAGCEMLGIKSDGSGELRIAFTEEYDALTRSVTEIPDTSEFRINITDAKGKVIYDGLYGDCPESMQLSSGSYNIKAVSTEFDKPAFSMPQYGDEQCVVVPDGGTVDVGLICRQMNSGVRLNIGREFLTECPSGVLFLKSDQGKLMYGYSEKRIAYFLPGKVSLVLSSGGKDETLMTRTLLAQEILSLKVNVASSGGSGTSSKSGRISVAVDTVRNWISDSYLIGGQSDKGTAVSDAMTVQQARDSQGSKDMWVCGYIVGGDLTSSSASFEGPFDSRSNLLLGPKSSTSDKEACLSVQLPAGDLRERLNLVDHPEMLGRKVYLRGDIVEAYFGIPGIKNISEYQLP